MDNLPINVYSFFKTALFGFVKISYNIEDRMPDEQDDLSKYKHYLYIKVGKEVYSWTFRSKYKYDDCPYIDNIENSYLAKRSFRYWIKKRYESLIHFLGF
jgi:hypothetical protein